MTQNRGKMEETMSYFQVKFALKSSQNEVVELNSRIASIMAKHEQLTSELQARMNKMECEKKDLQTEIEALKAKFETSSKSVVMKKKEWEELEDSVIIMMEETRKSEAQLELKNKEIKSLTAALNEKEQLQAIEIKSLKNTVSLHKEQEARMKKQREVWLNKKRALTDKLKETEETRNLFQDQFQQQKSNANTLTAALREARKKLKAKEIKCQEDTASLLEEKEDLNTLLKNEEEKWLKKERTMTVKLKEMEDASNFLVNQSEQQKKENNTLKAALMKAQKELKVHHIQWQQEKSSLLQETEAKNSLLKKEGDKWWKKEKVMTVKLKEMEEARHFFEDQSEQRKEKVLTFKAALKEAQQQLKTTQIQWQEEKSSLLQETEGQISLLKKEEEGWLKKERAMTSKFKEMEEAWKESVTTTRLLKKKLKNCESLLKEKEGAAHQQIVTVDKSTQTHDLRTSLRKQKQALDRKESKSSAVNDVKRWPQNEQHVKSSGIHRQKKKSSPLQEKDALNGTPVKMEQRWTAAMEARTSQLENLQSYDKKQKKWYKKLFHFS